jgi:hypothetical protein
LCPGNLGEKSDYPSERETDNSGEENYSATNHFATAARMAADRIENAASQPETSADRGENSESTAQVRRERCFHFFFLLALYGGDFSANRSLSYPMLLVLLSTLQ